MKICNASIECLDEIDGQKILEKIERCARKCYQTLPKGDPESFVRHIIQRGHTSVLEHVQLTFDITTDLGVLGEITRHRHASPSVESTRYCKYDNGNMTFINPIEIENPSDLYDTWKKCCIRSEEDYCKLMKLSKSAETARCAVNKSLKVNMTFSINLRSMRNLFSLRTVHAAHPHFRQISIPWLLWMKETIPVVFDDIEYDEVFYLEHKEELDKVVIK